MAIFFGLKRCLQPSAGTQTPKTDQNLTYSLNIIQTWLQSHAASAPELLMGFHKVATGRACVTFSESVDEALCVSWIDGTCRQMDVRLKASSLHRCGNPVTRVFIDWLGDFISNHGGIGMTTLWCWSLAEDEFQSSSGAVKGPNKCRA